MLDCIYIVDRIEGKYAVVEIEEGTLININKSDIIGNVKEGNVLIKKNNIYYVDIEKTKAREKEINDTMKGLWKE